jgi:hypothetical protein
LHILILLFSFFGLLYSVFALILYLRGRESSALWLAIPSEMFYLWEAVCLTAFMMVLWILFSAVAHLVSGHQAGRGCFETTLAVLGFAEAVDFTILFLVPDILVFPFEPSIGVSLSLCVWVSCWGPSKRELRAEERV